MEGYLIGLIGGAIIGYLACLLTLIDINVDRYFNLKQLERNIDEVLNDDDNIKN